MHFQSPRTVELEPPPAVGTGAGARVAADARAARSRWTRLPAVAVLLIAVAGVASFAATYRHFLNPAQYPVIRSDGAGYYSYLPAYLLQRDPTFRTFVATDLRGQTLLATGLKPQPATGRYLQRYPVGEAVMLTPFFLAGHAVARATGRVANGYSGPEQAAAGLGGLVYAVLGLAILANCLRRRFGPLVATAALVTLVFGTNLFHYATFDSMFSHAYAFFLTAALVWLVERWYRDPGRWPVVIGLGVTIGFIVLVRQSNVVMVLLVPLYAVWSVGQVRPRLAFLWGQRLRLLSMAALAAVVFSPQLLIWHEATGHWLVNSYQGDHLGFDFASPHLWRTLFSFNPHGLFPWSPILLLACLGVAAMWRHGRELLVPVVVIVALDTYVISSWTIWFYGGGYGQRGFIDVMPLLAFPLAALYAAARAPLARVTVAVPALACCALVTIQMIHYWQLKLPFNGASFHQYLHLLRTPL